MKAKYKIILLIMFFMIGIGKYIPIFFCPDFIRDFYFNNGLAVLFTSFGVLFFLIYKWKLKLFVKLIFAILPLMVLFSSGGIADINNQLIIKYNSNKDVFKSPVIGVKIDTLSRLGETVFVFNKQFGVFDALVYTPNHGVKIDTTDEFKSETFCHKIYNSDWWWYKHND